MLQKITPFLWFNDQAEEAANYYVSIFKNSKVATIVHTGDAGPGPKGSVLVVDFELEGQTFTALNGGPQFPFTEAVSFLVHCEDQKEVDYFWTKLTSDGGTESQCGWLKDKYGLSWQITPNRMLEMLKDPATSDKMMTAMMTMKKIDLKTLEDAVAR